MLMMGCCGLCRFKAIKPMKTSKNLTREKIQIIDTWMNNIEYVDDPIDLPTMPANEPRIVTNQYEQNEILKNSQGYASNSPMNSTNTRRLYFIAETHLATDK
jgi:hypothetical protein